MSESITLRAVSKELESDGYVRFRKLPKETFLKQLKQLEEDISKIDDDDFAWKEELVLQKIWIEKNLEKPWCYSTGEGGDYNHYATFEECVMGLLNKWTMYDND